MKLPGGIPWKEVLVPTLLCAGAVAGFALVVLPVNSKVREAHGARRALAASEVARTALATRETRALQEMVILREALGGDTAGLPNAAESFTFLERLGLAAANEGVTLEEIVPEPFEHRADVSLLPVRVRAKGPSRALLRFLTRVEDIGLPARVDRLSLRIGEGRADIRLETTIQVFCAPQGP